MSQADWAFFLRWLPSLAACLVLGIFAFVLHVRLRSERRQDGRAKDGRKLTA